MSDCRSEDFLVKKKEEYEEFVKAVESGDNSAKTKLAVVFTFRVWHKRLTVRRRTGSEW